MLNSRDKKTRVIVAGAGSIVAGTLVPYLLDRGYHLYLLGRERRWPFHAEIDYIPCDLQAGNEAVVEQLRAEKTSFIFIHLAPIWLLPDFLQKLRSRKVPLSRVVAFSSTSCLAKRYSKDIEERRLADRLAGGEEKMKSLCADCIPWTIFRPTLIYDGRRDKNISFISSFIQRFSFFPVAGAASGLRQPVHADDLAAATLAVLDNQRTFNTAYNLGGGETLTYRKMVSRIFQSLGKPERIISLPPIVFSSLVRLARVVKPRLGVSPAMVERMNEDLSYDFRAAERDFDYRPRGFLC